MTYQQFPIVFQGSQWNCKLVSQDMLNGKNCKSSDLHSHEPNGIFLRSQKSIYLGTTASTFMRGHCLESCARHSIDKSHNRAINFWKFIRIAAIAGGFFPKPHLHYLNTSSASALFQNKTLLALMSIKESFKTPNRFHPENTGGK